METQVKPRLTKGKTFTVYTREATTLDKYLNILTLEQRLLARANAFWHTAAVGEADSVSSVSASACQSSGPKGVTPR